MFLGRVNTLLRLFLTSMTQISPLHLSYLSRLNPIDRVMQAKTNVADGFGVGLVGVPCRAALQPPVGLLTRDLVEDEDEDSGNSKERNDVRVFVFQKV